MRSSCSTSSLSCSVDSSRPLSRALVEPHLPRKLAETQGAAAPDEKRAAAAIARSTALTIGTPGGRRALPPVSPAPSVALTIRPPPGTLAVSPINTACQRLTRILSLAFNGTELANRRAIGCDPVRPQSRSKQRSPRQSACRCREQAGAERRTTMTVSRLGLALAVPVLWRYWRRDRAGAEEGRHRPCRRPARAADADAGAESRTARPTWSPATSMNLPLRYNEKL